MSSGVVLLGTIPAAPVIAAMAAGAVMTLVGHIVKSNPVVGTGIAILFLATGAMVLFAYLDYSGGSDSDPRPKDDGLPGQVYTDDGRGK